MSSILETIMLICFGFSWPMNVIKAVKARSAKGMSLPFILLIMLGYIAGISAKLIKHIINGNKSEAIYVLVVYFINLAIVSVNLAVYFRNRHLDMVNDAADKN